MFPGINDKQMRMAMKKMGVQQEEIPAQEVVITCPDKKIRVLHPNVVKVKMMGQETLQITGEFEEEALEQFTKDDIKTVMEQTGCSEDEALKALEKTGDLAEAILSLQND